jgi:hypothetical protein
MTYYDLSTYRLLPLDGTQLRVVPGGRSTYHTMVTQTFPLGLESYKFHRLHVLITIHLPFFAVKSLHCQAVKQVSHLESLKGVV